MADQKLNTATRSGNGADDAETCAAFHGYDCGAWHASSTAGSWPLPKCVCASSDLARPKYSSVDASEYLDSADVLDAKVDCLIAMLRGSKATCIYSGAGISTSAGIGDYASKGKGSIVAREGGQNRLLLPPTLTHRVLAALEKRHLVHEWVQQNHDGLAQKAGYPFERLNEIHGSWFDRKNPVVTMDGQLRSDLYERLIQWEAAAELTLAMGTSLCGMNADRIAAACAQRHRAMGQGQGLVIINLQRTPMDSEARLRIFARTDDVFALVAKKLRLRIDNANHSPYPPVATLKKRAASVGVKQK
jgi:NAD-dependent histone deacetylase SIR2